METKTEKAKEVQGTDKAKGGPKMERQASASYTIKSFRENIRKMEKLKMMTANELAEIKTLYKTIVERWIGGNLNM